MSYTLSIIVTGMSLLHLPNLDAPATVYFPRTYDGTKLIAACGMEPEYRHLPRLVVPTINLEEPPKLRYQTVPTPWGELAVIELAGWDLELVTGGPAKFTESTDFAAVLRAQDLVSGPAAPTGSFQGTVTLDGGRLEGAALEQGFVVKGTTRAIAEKIQVEQTAPSGFTLLRERATGTELLRIVDRPLSGRVTILLTNWLEDVIAPSNPDVYAFHHLHWMVDAVKLRCEGIALPTRVRSQPRQVDSGVFCPPMRTP